MRTTTAKRHRCPMAHRLQLSVFALLWCAWPARAQESAPRPSPVTGTEALVPRPATEQPSAPPASSAAAPIGTSALPSELPNSAAESLLVLTVDRRLARPDQPFTFQVNAGNATVLARNRVQVTIRRNRTVVRTLRPERDGRYRTTLPPGRYEAQAFAANTPAYEMAPTRFVPWFSNPLSIRVLDRVDAPAEPAAEPEPEIQPEPAKPPEAEAPPEQPQPVVIRITAEPRAFTAGRSTSLRATGTVGRERLSSFTFVARDLASGDILRFGADANGHFAARLPAGRHEVHAIAAHAGTIHRSVPLLITVTPAPWPWLPIAAVVLAIVALGGAARLLRRRTPTYDDVDTDTASPTPRLTCTTHVAHDTTLLTAPRLRFRISARAVPDKGTQHILPPSTPAPKLEDAHGRRADHP